MLSGDGFKKTRKKKGQGYLEGGDSRLQNTYFYANPRATTPCSREKSSRWWFWVWHSKCSGNSGNEGIRELIGERSSESVRRVGNMCS